MPRLLTALTRWGPLRCSTTSRMRASGHRSGWSAPQTGVLTRADLDVVRVRDTKNPDRSAIVDLAPDLVVASLEENRRLDVERVRAAEVPVWVTVIESVDNALRSLRRRFT